jgi:glutaredoxin
VSYTVYSKENCPQCTQVIQVMKARKLEHTVLKLDTDFTREDLSAKVEQAGGPAPRSFPQVFLDGRHIGDFTAFREHVLAN